MALTNLLKILPLNARENPKLNFPFKRSTTPLQKLIVKPKPNYKCQNINIFSKFLRSSFFENQQISAASESQTSTSSSSPKMEREIANRRIAMILLMSIFVASSSSITAFAASSETKFIKKTISAHKIVIFSKSYCPYCRRAKEVFKELDQAPHVIELDEREDGYSIQDALSGLVGRRTVPQVFIDGKHIGGADDTIDAYQNGELAKLLGIESTEHEDL